ncbi:hypothetical protein N0V88_005526 [Collariella sp. IMI 366227]|nr:hypothetical protein N0V88_005526 [Collariella sp. IMI 366227]
MTHLYQFFGTLLGCTTQGMPGYATYAGDPSMFKVALAAALFGIAEADIAVVGKALNELFGLRYCHNGDDDCDDCDDNGNDCSFDCWGGCD